MLRQILIGACIILVGATCFLGSRYADSVTRVSDADQLDRATRSLLIALLDAETGQRGYIITGDPGYLVPYQAGITAVPERLAEVEGRGITTEKNAVTQISVLTHQKVDELAYTIKLRREQGQAAAQREVDRHLGKNLMDQIRVHIDHVEINCMATIDHAGAESIWYARLTFLSFLATLALTFPLTWLRSDSPRTSPKTGGLLE